MNAKQLRLPAAVAVGALLAAGIWLLHHQAAARNADRLTLYGNVDIREVNLGFRVTGRLADLSVDEGSAVKAGDVLGHLDDEPYRRDLRGNEAALASAKARYDLLLAGSRREDIAQAEALVDQMKAAREVTEANFQRQKRLHETGASSERQYQDALSQRDQSEASLRSAQEALARARNGNRAQDIAQGKADVARAEAALAQAQLRLADCVLQAPSDGVVTTRAVEPGAIVPAGATVFTISLRKPVWVRAYIAEPDLGRVHPGTTVSIHSDTNPQRIYRGTVGFVSPSAEFTPKSVETPDLRTDLVYRLRIVVEDADEQLRQGMPVTAEIHFDKDAAGTRHAGVAANRPAA
jgi:HlyD family secretion protein